ncbi:MAG: 3-hydroxyacyl-CoA dehydrogenase family protein [Dehalococcoidia bacterium]
MIGAGLMGHGIALELAAHDYEVRLYDRDPEQLARAGERVTASLQLLLDSGNLSPHHVATANRRLTLVSDLVAAVAGVDLVIEAVYEELAVKQAVFRELDAVAPERAIFASNTSSYMPSSLAAVTRRPDRVIVTHYFNPPHLLPLVEIVPGPETAPRTVEAMCRLYESIRKNPVVLNREIPGFVGNRLQTALLREALAIVAAGVASADDVDSIIRTGFGRRLALAGVFEVRDLSGWDVSLKVHEELLPEIDSSRQVPAVLSQIAAAARGDEPTKVARRAEITNSLAAVKRVLDG